MNSESSASGSGPDAGRDGGREDGRAQARGEDRRRAGKGGGMAEDLRGAFADVSGAIAEVREAVTGAREAALGAKDAVTGARDAGTSVLGGLGTLITAAVRQITDVDTIKALADPTRLAILRALMNTGRDGKARVMSAKELAEELGEPQTKLYRHLKQLESHGLIVVAETRVVSGIVETRYRAAQSGLNIDPDSMDLDDESAEELARMASVAIDRFRDEFLRLALADQIPMGSSAPHNEYDKGLLLVSSARMSKAKAIELRGLLQQVVDEFTREESDPDGVAVEMLIGWYSPPDSLGGGVPSPGIKA